MHRRKFLLAGLLAWTLGACASVGGATPDAQPGSGPGVFARIFKVRGDSERPAVRPGGKYVLIDIGENQLRFMDGKQVLWSAPVGTGTGLRLRGPDGEWDFATPTGTFQVEYKEQDPVWIVPDWYYIERKLPIPPENSPKRRLTGELGVAAVYIGAGLAIHGTDKPELLGQRVSHGCIRLADENALRLFHNVQIGTPVVITGRRTRVPETDAAPLPPAASKRIPAKPRKTTASSAQLLARLDQQLRAGRQWPVTASELISRGLDDDTTALRGLLRRAGRAPDPAVDREYATFLADAYSRGTMRAVVSLAQIEPAARERAAKAIVDATMDLYHGPLNASAPWPTQRVPRWRLGPLGRKGLQALQAAEAERRRA